MTGVAGTSFVLFGIAGLGMTEMMIIGIIAVILFGKKLPDVAKQLGGSYREFRKGLGDFNSHMDAAEYSASSSTASNAYNSSHSSSSAYATSYHSVKARHSTSLPVYGSHWTSAGKPWGRRERGYA